MELVGMAMVEGMLGMGMGMELQLVDMAMVEGMGTVVEVVECRHRLLLRLVRMRVRRRLLPEEGMGCRVVGATIR